MLDYLYTIFVESLYSERGLFDILFRFIYLLDFISDGFYKGRYNISFSSVCSLCVLSVDKLPPQKPSTRKTKVGKEVKEAIQPEIQRAKFSIIVEEPISTKPDCFLDADRDLEYIYFGSDTESETDTYSDSDVDFL